MCVCVCWCWPRLQAPQALLVDVGRVVGVQANPGGGDRGHPPLPTAPPALRREQSEGEDVPVVAGRQHELVVVAAADVLQVSGLVVMETESPVRAHGLEAEVSTLQQVDPDGARVHPAEQQLPVAAARHKHTSSVASCCCHTHTVTAATLRFT